MQFNPPLQSARLIRRYKRFLADVQLPDGSTLTLHCPNTGSMKNCQPENAPVLYSDSGNPQRKYRHTLEAVQVAHGHWAGVNTARSNALVAQALEQRRIPELSGFTGWQREVVFADSRLDFGLQQKAQLAALMEVKNVTLGPADNEPDHGVLAFPDAVTERGQKHLRTLMQVRASGLRAILFFCVQHTGAQAVRPADEVDPEYGRLLRQAVQAGVEVYAWRAVLSPSAFYLQQAVPVLL